MINAPDDFITTDESYKSDNPDLDDPDLSYFGWEPRVALDGGFRMFVNGLREKPTKKPILLFLPKGGPAALLAAFLGLFSDGIHHTVCLFEDEALALTFDSLNMPERIQKTTRVVIGDLKFLAKTDKDCYGGCVVLAYGVSMPAPRSEREHHSYLDDKVHFIAQLCGWSAHVLYLDQPFHDAPDDVLDEMAENSKARSVMCELSVTRDISVFGSRFRSCGRRVTLVCADLAGSDEDAALCLYVQLFRASGVGSRRSSAQGVPATIFVTERRAVKFYKESEGGDAMSWDGSPCWFMTKAAYDEWTRQEFEDSPKNPLEEPLQPKEIDS